MMKRFLAVATLALFLPSCTSYRAYQRAQELETLKDWDRAVIEYSKALEVDPKNIRYQIALKRAKIEASRQHFEKGRTLRGAGQNNLAALEFELAVKLDPTNQYAAVELTKAAAAVQEAQRVRDGNSLEQIKRRARTTKPQPPELNPASSEPISLSFPRETPVRDIYRALGNSFGINVLFDPQIKDERISIELRDVTAQAALERVMQAANHFYKVLDEKSIIVIPDNAQSRRDYEDLVIQTFYLSNGDAEQVVNILRTMLEARFVYPLKALNAITMRDTADKMRIAEKIIEANDKAKAEVVVDVELLQLDVTKARELGLQLINAAGGSYSPVGGFVDNTGKAITSVTTESLANLGWSDFAFTVPSVAYGFVKTNSDSQLLAKPQLRISEGEKATLHIGQRIPVPVSTFTSANTGGTGTFAPVTSFQYQDVGIKITIEPRVHHNREVTLKLTVEVSNLSGFAPATTPPQPIIGTRTIESTIRLKDGETNFLAGLIRKDDSTAANTTPFLGDLPVIGRLFSKDRKDFQSTDLVLTMTPNIIRIPDITDDDVAPLWVGTSSNLTFRGVSPRVESQSAVDPFTSDNFVPPPADAGLPSRNPATYVPPTGSAPGDPFARPEPPKDQPPVPQPTPVDPLSNRTQIQANSYALPSQPRIAPQPMTVSLKPGQETIWNVVGMDLAGLQTSELTLRYDPRAMDISGVSFGDALEINPETPPVANIDSASGTIRIRSSNGDPLRFRSGGDVVAFRVRGGVTGETYLVLDAAELLDRNGAKVAVAIAGGRANVE
jgi:general secretion pathway protein D